MICDLKSRVFVFIAIAVFGAGCATVNIAERELLKPYEGIYLGFAPTDESAVMLGEMEIAITGKKIEIRMATGLEIRKEIMRTSEFAQMTDGEVKAFYAKGSEYSVRSVGFKAKTESGFPKMIFLRNPQEDEFGLIIRTGGLGDVISPMLLFSPTQVARGDYTQVIRKIENGAGKGVLPRLHNGGKAEKK